MNLNKPQISVIVTTFNRKELLKETLDSILAQSFIDFELIVVDNFSNYDFMSFMETFNDERIRAFQNQNNGILAVNRNYGIKKAIGKYLAFCDDDDLWYPDKLKIQVSAMEDGDFSGCGTNITEFHEGRFDGVSAKVDKDVVIDFKHLVTKRSLSLSSLLVVNQSLFFNESKEYVTFEDFDYQMKTIHKTTLPMKYIGVPLVFYRIHPNANSLKKINTTAIFDAVKKYDSEFFEIIKHRLFFKRYYQAAKKCSKSGLTQDAQRYSLLALKNWRFFEYRKLVKLTILRIRLILY